MSFVTIAGITVPVVSGVKQPPEEGGSFRRAYAGNLRITKRWAKRSWKFQTMKMIEASIEAIEAAIALGAVVPCTGIAFDTLAAPTQNNPTTAAGGSTLAAATYFYKVTALKGGCESVASVEKSIATALNASNTISWVAVPGATGYRIYRGTATGAENVYYQVGAVTSYVDTNATSTAASPPTITTYTCTVSVEDTSGADYLTGTSSDGNNFYRALALTIREV